MNENENKTTDNQPCATEKQPSTSDALLSAMGSGEAPQWEIGKLKLHPRLIWSFAMSSMKLRISGALLTTLTITTATSFMMFLLVVGRGETAADIQSWYLMLGLALIVSAAGVLNTMMMSVTQRYREIGTLKCLGALDSLVLYSVLLESAIVGLIGAAVGVIIGGTVATIFGVIDLGSAFFSAGRMLMLPVYILVVFFVGMGLTTLGAAVPAYIAAKMPPIEAMRGEK